MSLAAPLGLLAAALAAPLVLWYVLRSRRPRVEVASTFLWQRTDRAVAAAVPWQRFLPDRTFWLVLAAILLGAIALARPAVEVVAPLGDHTILIVDASASMSADEDGATRLALARRRAGELVADLGPGQLVSVVEAAPVSRVLLSASDDPNAVRRAVGRAGPTQGTADLADALTLAAALERPDQRTVVHLLTDGELPPEVAALARPDLQLHAVGTDRPNLAVTRLEAVATGGGAVQAFVQVRNLGLLPTEARVELAVDGVPLVSRDLALDPRGTEDLVLPLAVASGAEVVQARVSARGEGPAGIDARDALALDDVAFATVAAPRTVTALVVSPGNVFLTSALESVEGVEVQTATAVPVRLDDIDLLVLDRVAPPEGLRLPTVAIAPTGPLPGTTFDGGAVELPSLVYQSPDHPLLADVDLAGTAIAEAQPIDAPALEVLAGGPAAPLLLAGRLDGTPVVQVTFDLLQSNLPLQVAWPVLVANTVSWLTAPPAMAPLQVGDEVRYAVPAGVSGVVLSPPDGGEEVRLDAAAPRTAVDRVGIWRARWDGPDEAVEALRPPPLVAVNAPLAESDLARDRPPLGTTTVAGGTPTPGTGQRVLGRELLAGVLVLLLADWLLLGRSRRRRRRPKDAAPAPPAPAVVTP
jgi:hypothetical protein